LSLKTSNLTEDIPRYLAPSTRELLNNFSMT